MAKKVVTYIINILVILAVLVVGLYGYNLISLKQKASKDAEEKTVYLTVEFDMHEKEILEKIEVGQELFDVGKSETFGTVKSVSPIEDSILSVSDFETGRYVNTTTSEYGLRTVVIECDSVVTPENIKVNNYEVRVGYELGLRTNDYMIKGRVMGIEFQE